MSDEPPSTAVEQGDELLQLSCMLGAAVCGPDGRRAGRLADVIVRLGDGAHPPVTGLVITVGGEERFAAVRDVSHLTCEEVALKVDPASLGRFERRPGEVLLGRDIRSRHVIHVGTGHLVRANDVELATNDGTWEVVAVDTSSSAALRRLLPRGLRRQVKPGPVLDWADIEPFVSHVPTSLLRMRFRKLARLHPAQLADLVEAASHEEGEEIIRAVGADSELEADLFEELDTEHQLEFLHSRSDEQAAALLSAMAPDDAVDLLTELDQERRLPILLRMPPKVQAKLRALLEYNPETAGGLMTPDLVVVPSSFTVEEALRTLRSSPVPAEAAGVIFVTDDHGALSATALAVDLLRADPEASVTSVARPDPVTLPPDADIHEVVRKMTDFNLAVAPVVDAEGHILGQITVDDVLELLLPTGWRRQYGMTSVE